MNKPRARLRDIAEATGYSINTVSLALRNSPRIGEATRELILQEAERQNYSPNRVAQSLVGKATRAVGLLVTDLLTPSMALAAREFERKLSAAGYGVLLAASEFKVEREIKALRSFQSFQVDGVLAFPAEPENLSHLQELQRNGTPVLILSDVGDSFDLNVVALDDLDGAKKVMRHLLARGHRRIAFVDGNRKHNTRTTNGLHRAMEQAHVPVESLIVYRANGDLASDGYRAMELINELDPPVTAVFASSDSLAAGAVSFCLAMGFDIPKRYAIVGYSNTELAEFGSYPLTTVHSATGELTDLAVSRIIELIEKPDDALELTVRRVEPRLVVRKTT